MAASEDLVVIIITLLAFSTILGKHVGCRSTQYNGVIIIISYSLHSAENMRWK